MDSQPIRDERILEALEVCRAHGGDLSDPVLADLADQLAANPELKRLYDRLQGVDAKLSAALHDVPVPEGLAQRIVDRLLASHGGDIDHSGDTEAMPQRLGGDGQAPVADVEETDESPPHPPATIAPGRPSRVSRRRLLAIAGTAGTAAVLLVAALIYIVTQERYDVPTVLQKASDFFSDESHGPGHLLADADDPLLEDYPFSRDVRRLPGTRWREVREFLGRDGVAYDLPRRGGGTKATLYVVKLTLPDLKAGQPPGRPQRNTANCCTAVWQSGKLLYVLVVRGSSGDYDACLAPTGTVT